jgi:TP901 family phage tail tape measure protein
MATDDQSIQITFTGNASQLQATAAQVKQSLQGVQGGTQQLSAATVAAGTAMGQVFVQLAAKAASYASEAIGAFSTVATEVYKMQNVMGDTAEAMSLLRFAGDEVGVSAATITKAMQTAIPHITANDEAFRQLGITAVDSMGRMRPSSQIFMDMTDALNKMANPMERTTAMRQLFGKSFAELAPLVNMGSEGIRNYTAEMQRLNVQMSEKDVQSALQLKAAQRQLNDAFEDTWTVIGRQLTPVLTGLVTAISNAVNWVVNMFQRNDGWAKSFRAVAAAIALVATSVGVYIVVSKAAAAATAAWTVVQSILNGVMILNPIGLVVAAIVALIAIIVLLVKNFEPVGDVFIAAGGIIGNFVGKYISVAITAMRLLAGAVLDSVDSILAGVGFLASAGDTVLGWFGWDTGMSDAIDNARNSIKGAKSAMDDTLSGWSDSAWSEGQKIGEGLARGIVDAIKKLKLPSVSGGLTPDSTPQLGDEMGLDMLGGGGGGKAVLDARKKAILDFFSNLVKSSREALDAAKAAAISARDKMRQISEDIASSIREGFNVTVLAGESGANYTGPGALINAMKRRLDAVKDFGSNIRKLAAAGLPLEMLSDIVGAGAERGAATARMLVANPESFAELAGLQSEINAAASGVGEFAGQALMGAQVAATSKAAFEQQAFFRSRLGAAQQIGYVPTEADVAAAGDTYMNDITINATTVASPKDIADAVAWALFTGVGLGMTPAGAPSSGGGTRKAPPIVNPRNTGTISGLRTIAGRT